MNLKKKNEENDDSDVEAKQKDNFQKVHSSKALISSPSSSILYVDPPHLYESILRPNGLFNFTNSNEDILVENEKKKGNVKKKKKKRKRRKHEWEEDEEEKYENKKRRRKEEELTSEK
jgi:hypothetical protein